MSYSVLISAAELAQHLTDPKWVVIDCRHDLMNPEAGIAAYREGHIAGARFAHLDHDLSSKRPGPNGEFRGRHPLPQADVFCATLRAWGIDDDTQVVAYDAQGGMYAARLWWMLRWVGHQAVAVLDGGLPAWSADGHGFSTVVPHVAPGTISQRAPLVKSVDAAAVLANIEGRQFAVIDARAADRFRGENETIDPVGGHIPGAKNRFFKDNLQADGRFKSAEQLHGEWSGVVNNPETSVMQCGSGVTACHNLLALEVAGLPGAALYPGSWSEWCSDTSRPVATGA